MQIKNSLFSRIKNYKLRLCAIVLCNLFAVFFSILSLFLLEPFLQLLFVGNFDKLSPISTIFVSLLSKTIDIQSLATSMSVMVVVVILLVILKNLLVVLSSWLMATIKSRFIQTIRNELYERITILPLPIFRKGSVAMWFRVP